MFLQDLTDVSKWIHMLTPFLTILSVIVEIAPIKINPWTAIFKYIGGIINKGVYTKLDGIEQSTRRNAQAVDDVRRDMEARFDKYDHQGKKQQASDMRHEIINFAENLKLKRIYSDKQFEYILDVISKYYEHCEKYNIKNHYIDEAHSFIRNEVRNKFKEEK